VNNLLNYFPFDLPFQLLDYLNDLWRFRVNDSTWTWISGSDTVNQPGVYGEKGIPNPTNHPGSRYGAVGWYDSLRKVFWMFGGDGYSNTSSSGSCRQSLHNQFDQNTHMITLQVA